MFNIKKKLYIKKLQNKYNLNIDMINLAFSYSTNTNKPNYKYLNAIIADWHNRGFTTREDVINWVKSRTNQK